MKEAQELHCHNCQKYVQFALDLSVDGDYKLDCPNCGHDHYRCVVDGKITERRWGRSPSQDQLINVYASSYTVSSTWTTATIGSGGTSTFMYQAWMNTTT